MKIKKICKFIIIIGILIIVYFTINSLRDTLKLLIGFSIILLILTYTILIIVEYILKRKSE